MTEQEKIKYLKDKGCDIELSLSFLGDFENYDETIQDFLDEVEEKSEKLEEYYNENKILDYATIAHSFKSNAKYIGFQKLVDISYQHELAGKEGNIDFIKENYIKLIDEINNVTNIAKQYLKMI